MFLFMFRAKREENFELLRISKGKSIAFFCARSAPKFLGFSRVNCGFWYVSHAKREENFAGFQGQSEVFSTFSREARENFGVS